MIYTLTLNPALDREMTVPEIRMGQVLRAQSIQTDYGGKGFNVSRALLALGMESTALGFIGGAIGDQMIAGLSKMGIRTDFIRVSGDTRINLSVVDSSHTKYLKVNEPGPLVSEAESMAMLEKVSHLCRPEDLWVIAGSSPPGIKPAFIANLVNIIQSNGGRLIVDMERDYLRIACAAKGFLVKPNDIEASILVGIQIQDTTDAIRAVSKICELGAQQVVISMGKAGAVYSDGSKIWSAEPPLIKERNPIGAGDAMVAGMVYAFENQLNGCDVLRWGVACGSAAASLDGTAVGSLELVQTLMKDVRIFEVSKARQMPDSRKLLLD